MPVVDFSNRKGNNFVWRDQDYLTEVVVNKTYHISEDFFPESLAVFMNGQKLDQGVTNDYVMLDDATLQLNFTKHNHTILTVGFLLR